MRGSRRFSRRVAVRFAACLAVICFLIVSNQPAVQAQTSFGTITGIVTDPSGAVVAGAKVTIANVDTNGVREFQTDPSGTYNVPSLPPGHYVVKVEASGFSTQQGTPLTLAADQTARIDFKLTVGEDFSIGYLDHTAKTVTLYLEESFTFQVLSPQAAVRLAYSDGKKK